MAAGGRPSFSQAVCIIFEKSDIALSHKYRFEESHFIFKP
jgi:hypothetical protein